MKSVTFRGFADVWSVMPSSTCTPRSVCRHDCSKFRVRLIWSPVSVIQNCFIQPKPLPWYEKQTGRTKSSLFKLFIIWIHMLVFHSQSQRCLPLCVLYRPTQKELWTPWNVSMLLLMNCCSKGSSMLARIPPETKQRDILKTFFCSFTPVKALVSSSCTGAAGFWFVRVRGRSQRGVQVCLTVTC